MVTPGDPNTDPVMKQAWIAVASVLPKSANFEAAAQTAVQDLRMKGCRMRSTWTPSSIRGC